MTTYQDQLVSMEAELNRAENRFLDPLVLDFWKLRMYRLVGKQNDQQAVARQVKQAHVLKRFMDRLVKSMYDAGVPLMTGTDALNPMSVPGFSLHHELALFVNVGVPSHEVLRAATARPAEFMGEAGAWGTVATGRRADLVLLNANPLDDVNNTKQIAGVMVRGRWLTVAEIQHRLDQFAKKYARLRR